jgi:hydrogenase nickel incorporation protein HypA/HybF
MHEMPYTQSILEMALKASDGKAIRRIFLRVGRLSAIIPASVEVFFALLSKGTAAEGSELVFETAPIVLTCRNCQAIKELVSDGSPPRQALANAIREGCRCLKADFTVSGGLSFEMAGIEVDETR